MESTVQNAQVFVGGQSRLPKEYEPQAFFEIVARVDIGTDQVTDSSFSPCSALIADFLRQRMIGIHLRRDEDLLLKAVNLQVHHRLKKAMLAAVRDLFRNYEEFRNAASPADDPDQSR